ncbi:DNA polymerase III subunit delta [Seongchinamella sediminis]|uniref:DNA polymerase III subunit delta n=1 Tax=Seongchinamella sediminis TaxID=2283635 RepID=A0A3L7DTD8_9GAMM|nr:DNA polymerase III subunit delta [Seongchinamella sediminis]RLQ20828.1 DNA polymerase III subunit delta [Seongchinamella sediminis]
MRVYPEKLAGQLQQQLLPVYLVSGDEPLLVQECCDQVRQAARRAGCSDREILDVSAPGFKWDEIIASAAAMSLFAERKLVELRIPSGKPGTEGSKALVEYLQVSEGSEDVLLIIAGKIDKQSTNSKWYKALDAAGATVQVWPVDARDLPRWLQQRVSAAGMAIDNEALQLLCERVEGNLLAAVQEVEKLKLLADDGRIGAATVTASVANNARYNLFDMTDNALRGNAAGSLKMLHGLRGEGTEPAVALWALLREIRTLHQARQAMDAGQNPQQALGALRVWKNRMSLMQGALGRHSRNSLNHLLEQASAVDGSIKGFAGGKPWDNLETLILDLAGARR